MDVRRGTGAGLATIAKEVKALASALRYAAKHGLYHGNPAAIIPDALHDVDVPRDRALTRDEYHALYVALGPDRRDYLAMYALCGLRESQLYRITARDVDDEAVHIAGTKTKRSDRWLPLNATTAAVLRRRGALGPNTALLLLGGATGGATFTQPAAALGSLLFASTTFRFVALPGGRARDRNRPAHGALLIRHGPAHIRPGGRRGETSCYRHVAELGHRNDWCNRTCPKPWTPWTQWTAPPPGIPTSSGAQGRNRTSDTRIFSPRTGARNHPRDQGVFARPAKAVARVVVRNDPRPWTSAARPLGLRWGGRRPGLAVHPRRCRAAPPRGWAASIRQEPGSTPGTEKGHRALFEARGPSLARPKMSPR